MNEERDQAAAGADLDSVEGGILNGSRRKIQPCVALKLQTASAKTGSGRAAIAG